MNKPSLASTKSDSVIPLPVDNNTLGKLAEHNSNLARTAQSHLRQHKHLVDAASELLVQAVPVNNDLSEPAQEWIIPDSARNKVLAALFLIETDSRKSEASRK
jgi:hypothetical protein